MVEKFISLISVPIYISNFVSNRVPGLIRIDSAHNSPTRRITKRYEFNRGEIRKKKIGNF